MSQARSAKQKFNVMQIKKRKEAEFREEMGIIVDKPKAEEKERWKYCQEIFW